MPESAIHDRLTEINGIGDATAEEILGVLDESGVALDGDRDDGRADIDAAINELVEALEVLDSPRSYSRRIDWTEDHVTNALGCLKGEAEHE